MEVVLVSIVLVVLFLLVTVLPVSICLNAARTRGIDPLVGLFVGLLFSWIGVVIFAPVTSGGRGAPAAPREPPGQFRSGERSRLADVDRQPVSTSARGR